MSKLLWITDDNVSVFNGDIIYFIEKFHIPIIESTIVSSKYGHPPIQHYNSKCKYFSNKEIAKKYLLENYQALSIDQVIKALGLKKNDKRINNLKEIIKSELKC